MSYIGQSPDTIVSRNSFDEFNYTATNSQTTFTGADTNNNTRMSLMSIQSLLAFDDLYTNTKMIDQYPCFRSGVEPF